MYVCHVNSGCFHPVLGIQIAILGIILLRLEMKKKGVFDQNVECLVIAEQTMVFSSSLFWFYFLYPLQGKFGKDFYL